MSLKVKYVRINVIAAYAEAQLQQCCLAILSHMSKFFLRFFFFFRSFFFHFPMKQSSRSPQRQPLSALTVHYPTTRASRQASLRDTPFNHYQITSTYYSHM